MERIKEIEKIKLSAHDVLVEVFEKKKTQSGIILPETSDQVIRHGVIIGKGETVPEKYAIGDIVLDYNVQTVKAYQVSPKEEGGEKRKFFIASYLHLVIVIDPKNFDNTKDPQLKESKLGKS